jgi:hypothetical protein
MESRPWYKKLSLRNINAVREATASLFRRKQEPSFIPLPAPEAQSEPRPKPRRRGYGRRGLNYGNPRHPVIIQVASNDPRFNHALRPAHITRAKAK